MKTKTAKTNNLANQTSDSKVVLICELWVLWRQEHKMKKRKLTKEQREQNEKAKLHNAIALIAYGVTGGEDVETNDYMFTVDHLARLLPALKKVFNIGDEYKTHAHLLALWNLDKYLDMQSMVDFYWEAGVRI